MCLSSKEKGDIAMGKAISHYLSNKNEVCLPIGDKKKYDLIVDDQGNLLRIQCKYTSVKDKYGKYQVPLRVMGGNQSYKTATRYKEGDFDLLFVCTKDMDIYEIPYDAIKSVKTTVSLGSRYQSYKL